MERVSELHTTLKKKYTIQKVLRKSQWALVFEARKKSTGDMVAVRVSEYVKIGNISGAKEWNDVATRIALRHPNILEVSDFYYNRECRRLNIISPLMGSCGYSQGVIFPPGLLLRFNVTFLALATSLLTIVTSDTDLHTVVRAKILTPVHIQYIAYQLLEALSYVHYNGFVISDLKVREC